MHYPALPCTTMHYHAIAVPIRAVLLVLQRRLAVLRLLAPHEGRSAIRAGRVGSCGASKRDCQTRRCNTRRASVIDARPVRQVRR